MLNGISRVCEDAGISLADVAQVLHGTNLANIVNGVRVHPRVVAERFELHLGYDAAPGRVGLLRGRARQLGRLARLWAAHIVPEDRARTFAEMERVRGGEAVVYEFRILRPSDGSFRCIRNHGFPLFDEDCRVRRIGGITTDVTEMRQAEHHQRVLLAELQQELRGNGA